MRAKGAHGTREMPETVYWTKVLRVAELGRAAWMKENKQLAVLLLLRWAQSSIDHPGGANAPQNAAKEASADDALCSDGKQAHVKTRSISETRCPCMASFLRSQLTHLHDGFARWVLCQFLVLFRLSVCVCLRVVLPFCPSASICLSLLVSRFVCCVCVCRLSHRQ